MQLIRHIFSKNTITNENTIVKTTAKNKLAKKTAVKYLLASFSFF